MRPRRDTISLANLFHGCAAKDAYTPVRSPGGGSGDRVLAPGLVGTEFVLQPGVAPLLVFSRQLLLRWVRSRWPRRFVVTIKFKGEDEYGALEQVKHALPPLCADFRLIRLCANKNEACAFGEMSRPLSERH
jgi:hypothetical protein